MTNPASEGVEQKARELLAAELCCPVKSATEPDLSDKDRVFTDQAIAAIIAALRLSNTDGERIRREAWRPISEAPKDGTWILAAEDNGPDFTADVYAASWISEGYWIAKCGQYVTQTPEPTHWMPLIPISTPQEEA